MNFHCDNDRLSICSNFDTLYISDFEPSQVHVFWKNLFQKYGPIVKMTIPGMPVFVVSLNPDDLEVVMKSTMHNPVRDVFHSLKKIRTEEPNNFFNQKSGILVE